MTSRLFSPLDVGPLTLPSRVVMAPMDVSLAGPTGEVDERYIAFMRRRAGSGLGWLTTGGVAIRGDGLATPHQLRLDDDARVEGFARLADAVHAEGGRLVVQLTHAGRQTLAATIGETPVAPSALPCPVMRQRPRALAADELPAVSAAFADAARRAAAAGADGVELHMGHGYLLNQFLSPASNVRDDGWGGDTDGRCRLPVAVLAAVRDAVGPDRAVIARISADERMEGGIDPAEAEGIAARLAAGGADALHVSACTYGSMVWNIPVYLLPDACFRPLAARVRRVVDVPVIAVGRLHTPELMEQVLASGDADLLSVGRPLLADPAFLARIRAGEAPRPCLKCNRCIQSIASGPVRCSVNPSLRHPGQEAIPAAASDEPPARVLVAGGGPAGMHAAALAARLGHDVLLAERSEHLGGQLALASIGPHKSSVASLWRHLERELRTSGATVERSTPVTDALVARFDPTHIVDACGSAPTRVDVPGTPSFPRRVVDDALRDTPPARGTIVVLGAGPTGVEAALALAADPRAAGAKVLLAEQRPRIGVGLVPHARFHAERLLAEAGVAVVPRVRALHADGPRLRLQLRRGDPDEVDDVSLLVLATGRRPIPLDPAIYARSRACVIPVGDALQPASILEALETAQRAIEELSSRTTRPR